MVFEGRSESLNHQSAQETRGLDLTPQGHPTEKDRLIADVEELESQDVFENGTAEDCIKEAAAKDILKIMTLTLPVIQHALDYEVGLALSDKEHILSYQAAKDLDLKTQVNSPLRPGTGIYRVIHENLPYVAMRVDKTTHGVPYIAKAAPIYNSAGETIGAISITQSVEKQEAMREMASNLLGSINLMAQNAEEITAQAEEMSGITQILERMVDQSKVRVSETNLVLEFIKGLAKQTNLLGLNAAIEAARFGEQGRGFGVVAEEIRKLATSSSESISKISTVLQGIQTDSESTYAQVSLVETGIHNIAEAITQMSAATQELRAMAALLDEKAETI